MTSTLSAEEWRRFLERQPRIHLLQTPEWGELKRQFGWSLQRPAIHQAGAQVLFRRLPFGFKLAYVPKGPLGDWLPDLIPALDEVCQAQGAFALKIEPDGEWDGYLADQMRPHGFRPSPHAVQPQRTLVIDLSADEDAILGRMHQKTRYNIRLAGRKGVKVRAWEDLEAFARMMSQTAERQEFGAHVADYYRRAYELFRPAEACEVFVAEYEDLPLAALMVFAVDRRAWYLYGASTELERGRMPSYALQWQAIRWARRRGCLEYDLWGVPDEEHDRLESQFAQRSDGLWGVYRFKRGFGGELRRGAGAWDRVYQPVVYAGYRALAGRIQA